MSRSYVYAIPDSKSRMANPSLLLSSASNFQNGNPIELDFKFNPQRDPTSGTRFVPTNPIRLRPAYRTSVITYSSANDTSSFWWSIDPDEEAIEEDALGYLRLVTVVDQWSLPRAHREKNLILQINPNQISTNDEFLAEISRSERNTILTRIEHESIARMPGQHGATTVFCSRMACPSVPLTAKYWLEGSSTNDAPAAETKIKLGISEFLVVGGGARQQDVGDAVWSTLLRASYMVRYFVQGPEGLNEP